MGDILRGMFFGIGREFAKIAIGIGICLAMAICFGIYYLACGIKSRVKKGR